MKKRDRGSNGKSGSKWIRKAKRLAIYMRDGFCCVYCGKDLFEIGDEELCATLDHVVPRCRGGSNSARNLVTACYACNSKRGGRLIVEWKGEELAVKIRRLVRRKLPLELAKKVCQGAVSYDVCRLVVS